MLSRGTAMDRRTFLAGVGAALGAIACGPAAVAPSPSPTRAVTAAPATATATPAPRPATVKFATVASGAVGFLTHVMTQRKINEKYALTLDLAPADPAAAEKAVLLKQVDAGLFPIISTARANLEGQPITIFGPLLWSHFGGVTFVDRPYTKLADLKGKKIATLAPISGTYQLTQVLAAVEGLDFVKDFEVVTGPPPAVLAFLERGDVEGIVHFEPNIGNLLLTGKYKAFLDHNAEWKRLTGQSMFSIGLAAHQPWIDANLDVARRLVAASLETAQVIQRDPSVFQEFAKFLGLDTPERVKAAQERMGRIYPTEWNAAIADNAGSIVSKAVELKILAKAPDRRVTVIL